MDGLLLGRLVAVPLIGAATGYLTNAVAVRMLFRPRRERRFLGLRFQGLIPRRRGDIARQVGETVERHLISHADIKAALATPDMRERMLSLLDARVDRLIERRLAGLHPMAGMFLAGPLKDRIKAMVMEEVGAAIEPMTEEALTALEERLNFRELVARKIEEFDLETFESIVTRIAARELRAIEVWGGVLGFGIGLLTDLLFLF